MQKFNAFILFGAPGCGKGTQGRALGALPNFFHCACGDVFRSISSTTPLGRKAAQYSNKGELVPDIITIELWKSHINSYVQTHQFDSESDVLILDGIPRNSTQASLLDDTINVKALFHFLCDNRSELENRLRRRAKRENRVDDTKRAVIRHRLEVFENMSRPVLDFYGPESVYTINSLQNPVDVLFEILRHIRQII